MLPCLVDGQEQVAIGGIDVDMRDRHGLKIFKNSFKNIKQFTADEFWNMIKVFILGIIKNYHKDTINNYLWNKMYLYNCREYFLELDLNDFKVLF